MLIVVLVIQKFEFEKILVATSLGIYKQPCQEILIMFRSFNCLLASSESLKLRLYIFQSLSWEIIVDLLVVLRMVFDVDFFVDYLIEI